MIANAIRADKMPMRVAATHPCSLSQVFAIDPRSDFLEACRSLLTLVDSLIYCQLDLSGGHTASCSQSIVT
jgi:hypothetical protein